MVICDSVSILGGRYGFEQYRAGQNFETPKLRLVRRRELSLQRRLLVSNTAKIMAALSRLGKSTIHM